ncbi:MAG: YqaE/Pmp3 family membrane protein [Ferruginibacter sp.]
MKKPILLTAILFFAVAVLFNPLYAAVEIPSANVADRIALPDSASVKNAMAEFKSLSRKDKKERFKLVKKEMKAYKTSKRNGEGSTDTLLLVILAILLPPLAVYLKEGVINKKFWIDLILTLLFYLPGMIYALVVVLDGD